MTESVRERMTIVVFGAAGGTGTQVLDCALAAGHVVVAAVRRPDSVAPRDRLRVVKADVLDAASVSAAVVGADAVISTIGPASNRKAGTLISDGTHNMLAACADSGVGRFVFESGMITSDGAELSTSGRLATKVFGLVYPALKADKLKAEAEIAQSSLDWVIVRPPALNHSPANGNYLAGPGARIQPAKSLAHADCAAVLVKSASWPEWTRQVVNVGRS